MNYNITSYIIYIPIISYIMIIVGRKFYRQGEVFLFSLFQGNIEIVKSINKVLLIGYYLINLGYAILTISFWEQIETAHQLIYNLSNRLGLIIIGLGILHYNNIICLKLLVKSNILKQ